MDRRTWHLCVVPGCSDTYSTRHQFPNRDKDRKRFDVWLQLVQNPNLLELDPKQVFTNYSVCHQHFTANDKSSNMFLVRTAIPIHNLPPATGSTPKVSTSASTASASVSTSILQIRNCLCQCKLINKNVNNLVHAVRNVKNIKKLGEQELSTSRKTSWHDQYKDSAWIFVGGLPYNLTEGDIITIFSQYGEVVNINLIRDKDTGKQKGYGFICYEDQRSTVLAVDNFNGIKILGRTIRVDHVANYKAPKESKNIDEETKQLRREGCAPKSI